MGSVASKVRRRLRGGKWSRDLPREPGGVDRNSQSGSLRIESSSGNLRNSPQEPESKETQNMLESIPEQDKRSDGELGTSVKSDSTHPGNMDFNILGAIYQNRFQHSGQPEDLDKAIEYMSRAIASISEDHQDFSNRLASLGLAYNNRFQAFGKQEDYEKTTEYMSRALALAPGSSCLPHWLGSLGLAHRHRFHLLGDLDDIEKAIEYESRALTLTPGSHRDLPSRLSSLWTSHQNRFQRLGELGDLNKVIEYMSRALALIPDDHADLLFQLGHLAMFHDERFRRLGEPNDIEKVIALRSRAVASISGDNPFLPQWLGNLGISHCDRFLRLGEIGDIEKAIGYISRALTLAPNCHPGLPHWLASLGVAHGQRFHRLYEVDDVDQAIEYTSRALSLTPDDHPDLPNRLANLGMSYCNRFERLGELDDLDKAIEYESRALTLAPDGHPNLPQWISGLVESHTLRFNRLGQLDDIEKAINYGCRVLDLAPNGHTDLPRWLVVLGVAHRKRFELLGEPDDAEKAIEYGSRALVLEPEDHPDLPNRLGSLGAAYGERFRRLGQLDDVEKAVQYISRKLAMIPDGHPKFPDSCYYLATLYFLKYQHTGDRTNLQDSLDSFRKASRVLAGSPREKFRNAHCWATLASKHTLLNCIEAYQTTMDLLPQFIWLGATASQRYEDLSIATTLAVDAASAAILYSDHALAIEWLEHGRCVVWNQSLTLRSPLDRLQAFHPDLASQLQNIANQLQYAGSEPRESRELSSNMVNPEQAAQRHHRLAQEYDNLLSQARKLSGFEDFLQQVKANELAHTARNGPIAVINCSESRCDALLILPGKEDVNHLPLPNFSAEKAKRARSEIEMTIRSGRLRERGERRPLIEPEDDFRSMLVILWYDVVKPVLDFLGYTNNPSTNGLPHITWCPTGAVSFLPLHAAGDYDQPGSRVFDYIISSYTPTLTALLASTPSILSPDSRVLAIGQEATPGHTRLPGTSQELAYIQDHVQTTARYTQLVNDQATTAAVLDAMEQHDWVHLACHAHQNVGDPTESGFFLHDGTLDLAAINRRSFKNKGLAYLSACQTAMGDKNLPDEAIHLASGMLMAGYTSVIATMWSVHDVDAPLVADKVYAQLIREGKLGNGEAGRALHNAVAELRDKIGEKEFDRWVPYIHIGS